jgi:hypothetical protein
LSFGQKSTRRTRYGNIQRGNDVDGKKEPQRGNLEVRRKTMAPKKATKKLKKSKKVQPTKTLTYNIGTGVAN